MLGSTNPDDFAKVSMVLVIASSISLFFPWITPSLGLAAVACGWMGRESTGYGTRALISCIFGMVSTILGMALILMMAAIGPYLGQITDLLSGYIN